MKAVGGEVPADEDGWAFEIKWDGMRVTSILGGDDPVAVSTNGHDAIGRFPELRLLSDHLGAHRVTLDGEIVVLDDRGRSDFGRLQPRMQAHSDAAVARLLGDGPATYVVFDLLGIGDLSTMELPYLERRRLLADLLDDGPTWRVPEHRIGGGHDLFEAAAAAGLEGIMAKRIDSPYLPGRRSSSWRKCKVRHRQEFVVGGWTRGEGTRGSTLGSLHVGYHDRSVPGSPLRYAGRVGSGLTDAALHHLVALLEPLRVDACPFDPPPPPELARGSTWVTPELVVEVAFANWTDAGNIRAPVHLGLRDDKDPATVVREPTP